MSEETPVKKMTATELREIKGLIKQDGKILHDELWERKNAIDEALRIESARRQQEAQEVINKAFKAIQTRVDALNEAITKVVEDLNVKGIVSSARGYRSGRETVNSVPLTPETFHVSIAKPNNLYLDDPSDLYDATAQVQKEFSKSLRDLDKLQYVTTKDLVSQFVSSDVALEFIRALPTVESMLALPAPVADVDLEAIN